MESLLLHPQLLPRERDGLLPHTHVLLHVGLRDLPRSSAALRSHQGPIREHAADSRHRAGLSLHPRRDEGGRGEASEVGGARGEPAVRVEHDMEAVAAALLLHVHTALSVPGG